MLAPVTEHGNEKVRSAISDKVLRGEIWCRSNKYGDFDNAGDIFQIAKRGFRLRQNVDCALPRCFLVM